jgi:UDP-N-acetylmuramate dehydrogenase
MDAQTLVPLAPLTTFHIGGPARYFFKASTEEDVERALLFAHEQGLSLFVLGAGSNILVPDSGLERVVLHMKMDDMTLDDRGDHSELVAGAGMLWEDVVDIASARGLYGVENLAGIPGTLGGALVQNIGAYGAEFSSSFLYAEVIHTASREKRRITKSEALFSYRSSFFKMHPEFVIIRVALTLSKNALLETSYSDLVKAKEEGAPLTTPAQVAHAVRAIRSCKFPSLEEEGTAGSFFKNPILPEEKAVLLQQRFPELPTFPQGNGFVKISLAWVLDHALSLKGYTKGNVRLYEKQPLVVVAKRGATAIEVDALGNEVSDRVKQLLEINIEREVETISEE